MHKILWLNVLFLSLGKGSLVFTDDLDKTVHLIRTQTSYAAHGDDLNEKQVLHVTADVDSCDYPNDHRVCQVIIVVGELINDDQTPIFPFLIDEKTPENLDVVEGSRPFCEENDILYTLRVFNLPLNFTITLSNEWISFARLDPQIHFVYLIYSENQLIQTPNFHAIPVLESACTYHYESPSEQFDFHHFIAKEGELIFTEGFSLSSGTNLTGSEEAWIMFMAGSMSAEIPDVYTPRAIREPLSPSHFYPMISVNWRMAIISTRGLLFNDTRFTIINRHLNPLTDIQTDFSNESYMTWSENSYNYPASSKIPFNQTRRRDFASFTRNPSHIYLKVCHIQGGKIDVYVNIFGRPDFLFTGSVSWCQYTSCTWESDQVMMVWTPDPNPNIQSQFVAYFEWRRPDWDDEQLCDLPPPPPTTSTMTTMEPNPWSVEITRENPAYSGHGDDVNQGQVIHVEVDETSCPTREDQICQVILIVGLISDRDQDPIFPFQVNEQRIEEEDLEIEKDLKFDCGDDRVLYTMRLYQTNLIFSLEFSDEWIARGKGLGSHFAYTIYTDKSKISTSNVYAIPASEVLCVNTIGSSDSKEIYETIVAPRGLSIFTKRLEGEDCPDQEGDSDTKIDIFSGSIPSTHRPQNPNLLTSFESTSPLIEVNWRIPMITISHTSCLMISAKTIDPFSKDQVVFDEKRMSWMENSFDYPNSSKIGLNESWKLANSSEISYFAYDLQNLRGGRVELRIFDSRQTNQVIELSLTEPSPSPCSYLAESIEFSWLPNETRFYVSHFSIRFEIRQEEGRLCELETGKKERSGRSKHWIRIVGSLIVVLIFILSVYCVYRFRRTKNKKLDRVRQMTLLKLQSRRNFSMAARDQLEQEGRNKSSNLWEVKSQLLIIEEKIGRGQFSENHLGKLLGRLPCTLVDPNLSVYFPDCSIGFPVVVKRPVFSQRDSFLAEIELMKSIGYHPYILCLIGCSTNPENPMIVTEFCEMGDLHTQLRMLAESGNKAETEDHENLSESDFPYISWQVANAMEYLSSIKVIHRDIAARNVLLTREKKAKLSDFGLSRREEKSVYLSRDDLFSLRWTSPEGILKKKFSQKSDVWSFGVLLWEIYSFGELPFNDFDDSEVQEMVLNGEMLEKPEGTPKRICELMSICWKSLPEERPSFSKISNILYHLLERKPDHDYYLQIDKDFSL